MLWLLFPRPPGQTAGELIRYLTLTQNLAAPMPPGAWFAVSWSLVVEEWFYLLFGAASFVAFALVRRPGAIWLPIMLFIGAPTVARLLTPAYLDVGQRLYEVGLLRLDEPAYGVAIAALYEQRSRLFRIPWAVVAALAGATLLAIWVEGSVWVHPLYPERARVLIHNVIMAGCALQIPLALRLVRAPAAFAWPVATVSAISYGLYLMHLTILVEVAQRMLALRLVDAWGAAVIAICVPFVLAWLSWRYFEEPLLRRRPQEGRRAASEARPA